MKKMCLSAVLLAVVAFDANAMQDGLTSPGSDASPTRVASLTPPTSPKPDSSSSEPGRTYPKYSSPCSTPREPHRQSGLSTLNRTLLIAAPIFLGVLLGLTVYSQHSPYLQFLAALLRGPAALTPYAREMYQKAVRIIGCTSLGFGFGALAGAIAAGDNTREAQPTKSGRSRRHRRTKTA
jgi:hypothetical protein